MTPFIVPTIQQIVDMQSLYAAPPWGGTCHVHLTKSPLSLDKNTSLADLQAVESSFAGYAVAFWGNNFNPGIDSNQEVSTIGAAQFQCLAPPPTEVVYSWFITDTTDSILYWYGDLLDQPIPMVYDQQWLMLTTKFYFRSGNVYQT